MAVTVQMQFESVITELYQDAFVGSSIENGATIIQFDLRNLDFHRALGTTATICWRKEPYDVDIHELSTFHNPIKYRFIVAQGSYLNDQHQRVSFTPEIKGVSTSQHMSHSVIRLACYLAVVCGVSLRHIALLFSALFLIPITKSSIKRWIDDIGTHLPAPEEMLRQLLALTPATECHIDGYYPLGTDHCVMVVKDEHDRILMTHEAASENGEEARKFLQRVKRPRPQCHCGLLGLLVQLYRSHQSDLASCPISGRPFPYGQEYLGAPQKIAAIVPPENQDERGSTAGRACLALAKKLWTLRWSLLKKPSHLSVEEKQSIAELESEDEGFVHSFRSIIRQLVNIFDHAHSEAQARLRLKQLRQDIHALEDHHLEKIPQFFDDHWDQALRYLRKKGMGKHRRGSNSESGMRLLRRLEKNHDGIRSATTRQHYIQIYQAILSLPRYCRVYRARPSNDGATTCVKGGTHPSFSLGSWCGHDGIRPLRDAGCPCLFRPTSHPGSHRGSTCRSVWA